MTEAPSTSTSIERRPESAAAIDFTPERVNLIKAQLMRAPGGRAPTDQELALFVEYAKRTGLDPFTRQIHAIPVYDSDAKRYVFQFHVGIDGLRLVAERTGEYQGQEGPWWCGPDGQWRDVWLADSPPAAARVRILRLGRRPVTRVVKWREFARYGRDGKPVGNWKTHPAHMLAIRAEAHALRAAFPRETHGLYVDYDRDGEASPHIANPDAPASNAQKGELVRLATKLGWDQAERREQAGVESFTELTKGVASVLIDRWRALLEDGEIVDAEWTEDAEGSESGAYGEGAPDSEQPVERGAGEVRESGTGDDSTAGPPGVATAPSATEPPAAAATDAATGDGGAGGPAAPPEPLEGPASDAQITRLVRLAGTDIKARALARRFDVMALDELTAEQARVLLAELAGKAEQTELGQ